MATSSYSRIASVIGAAAIALAGFAHAQGVTPDPRAGLKPGLHNAGVAAHNMRLVSTQALPDGFRDPVNPAGFIMPAGAPLPGKELGPPAIPAKFNPGSFVYANTDIVFRGEQMFVGNFHGFNVYDLKEGDRPKLASSVVCPGGQADLSVYGNLLFSSIEMPFARVDCGQGGTTGVASKERFRGVRIFDVSNPVAPRQVAAVQTCRGSHTNTIVPDPKDRNVIYLYSSATSSVRSSDELAGCVDSRRDPNSSYFSIDVIKVELDAPERAHVQSQQRLFADAATGANDGLWKGGEQGQGGQAALATDGCHDITSFPAIGLAAAACQGNGLLLDIADPANPKRIDQISDPNFAFWHSATFSNDGSKVVFTDEWGGGARAHCLPSDPKNWGGDALFDVVGRHLEHRSYYKIPPVQGILDPCVAHNGGLVPVPGRDILVQAWFGGGISVVDFTDTAKPVEIAFFDRGPPDPQWLRLGGNWSAYWYMDRIYSSEVTRGLDVLELIPSEHLSANEIAAAKLARTADLAEAREGLNPQTQPRMTWPDSPVVARAYLDQLRRGKAISVRRVEGVEAALLRQERRHAPPADLRRLVAELRADAAASAGRDADRLLKLAQIIDR